jgi:hypothetical protein
MWGFVRQKTFDALQADVAQLRADLHIQTMRAGGPTSPPPEYDEIRLGVRYFDPLKVQAQLRGEVESTIKVEIYPDRWIFKCRRPLTEPEKRQLEGILGFKLDWS